MVLPLLSFCYIVYIPHYPYIICRIIEYFNLCEEKKKLILLTSLIFVLILQFIIGKTKGEDESYTLFVWSKIFSFLAIFAVWYN
jgi:hypothetical protein